MTGPRSSTSWTGTGQHPNCPRGTGGGVPLFLLVSSPLKTEEEEWKGGGEGESSVQSVKFSVI